MDFKKALFYAGMTNNYAYWQSNLNGLTDSFDNLNNLNLSACSGYIYECSRHLITQNRSNAFSLLYEPFDNISLWTPIVTGTANLNIVNPYDIDPAIGNVLNMTTGAMASSVSGVQRNIGSIPSSYGMMILTSLNNVGTEVWDAQNIWIENIDGKLLRLRLYYGALTVEIDSAIYTLSNHICPLGIYGTEWWVEVNNLGNGQHSVSLYAGTECFGSVTGVLPSSNFGNGFIYISQQSVTSNYRQSQMAHIGMGTTQLPDNMTIVSNAKNTNISPALGGMSILVEDVSNSLSPNNNFIAKVSKDNGQNWTNINLLDNGVMGKGVLDTEKNIHLLYGDFDFVQGSGTNIVYKIETNNGIFSPIANVTMYWE